MAPSASSSSSRRTGAPPLKARWFYARDNGWAIFSDEDDARLEARWCELGGEDLHIQLDSVFTVKNAQGDFQDARETHDGDGDDDPHDEVLTSGEQGQQAPTSASGQDEREPSPPSSSHDKQTRSRLLWTPPSGVDELKSKITSFFTSSSPAAGKEQEQERKAKELGVGMVRSMGDGKIQVDNKLDPDQEQPPWKVPVLEDALFDADLRHMVMYPVFFKGVLVRILRATYFYSSLADGSYVPVGYLEPLAQDLEKIYHQVRPWEQDTSKPRDRARKGKADAKADVDVNVSVNLDANTNANSDEDEDDDKQDDKEEEEDYSVTDSDRLKAIAIPSMKEQSGEVVWQTGTKAKIFRCAFHLTLFLYLSPCAIHCARSLY